MGAVFRPEDVRRRRWVREALRDLTPEAARRVEELLERREGGWEEELERILGKERSRRLLEGLGRW
jgi:Arc/MetJ family transcription regulator